MLTISFQQYNSYNVSFTKGIPFCLKSFVAISFDTSTRSGHPYLKKKYFCDYADRNHDPLSSECTFSYLKLSLIECSQTQSVPQEGLNHRK